MTEQEVRKLAETHWEFIERWLHMVYVDAMIHGFGHGYEVRQREQEINGNNEIIEHTM